MPKKRHHEPLEFESFKKLKSYILSIADNKVKEYYKKRQKNNRNINVENIGESKLNQNIRLQGGKRSEAQEELIVLVKRCYKALPKSDQEVLFYSFHGYSSKEVAEELGITPGTARARKRRALIKLKELMMRNRERK